MASPAIWSAVTGVESHNDVSLVLTREFNSALHRNKGYVEEHGATGWFSDQEFLFEKANSFEVSRPGSVRKFSDKETGHLRLDRIFAPTPLNWLLLPLVALGLLTDYHVHHPADKYLKYIRAVYQILRIKAGLRSKFANIFLD
jgi:hypothetical protein